MQPRVQGACPPYACPRCRSGVEAMGIQALARANQLEGQLQQGLAVVSKERQEYEGRARSEAAAFQVSVYVCAGCIR